MKKVLITTATFGKYNKKAFQILRDAGLKIVVAKQPVYNDDQLIEYLEDTVAIITGLEPITKKVIYSATDLKVIAKHGIGVDNIDLYAAKNKGIRVINAPGTNCEAVADLVFGLMLSLARRIPESDRLVKSGQWCKIVGKSVWGKTLGIIGLGAIGKSVARRAVGFNMKILAYDIFKDENFVKAYNIKWSSIPEILSESDYITLHVPLTDSTRNLIGYEEFKLMKPTAYLINTARGGVVDEEALYEALKNNKIAGAALDTFKKEPPLNSPLLNLKNVILTPHTAGYTDQALSQTSLFTAEMVVKVLRGVKPKCAIV